MTKRLVLLTGVLVLAAAWLGPLPAAAREAFWAHMTIHMAVVAVAAPLLALALATTRHDPARLEPGLTSPTWGSGQFGLWMLRHGFSMVFWSVDGRDSMRHEGNAGAKR